VKYQISNAKLQINIDKILICHAVSIFAIVTEDALVLEHLKQASAKIPSG